MEAKFFNRLDVILQSRSRQAVEVDVDITNHTEACIEWTGFITKSGYGDLHLQLPNGKKIHTTAHRGAYMMAYKVTQIPSVNEKGEKLEVGHLCHNKKCLNSTHLILESMSINRERKMCFNSKMCIGHTPVCILKVRIREFSPQIYTRKIVPTCRLV